MFERIVIGFNRTPEAEAAFLQALELARHLKARLFLFEALELPVSALATVQTLYTPWVATPEQEEFLKASEAILQEHCESARQAGVSTEFEKRLGPVQKLLCDYAQEVGADLIVIGHRDRSGLSEMIHSSLSNYLLHHSPVTLMVVQTPAALQQ
ncbi:MAG: universal stress protein [Gemmatimonadaceae bacterium]|nr:universal stress protein [Gloeobacterales cyanobacterium ES-bin-141]